MEEMIMGMNDYNATRVLKLIAKHHFEPSGRELVLSNDLKDALSRELAVEASFETVSNGDIARQALLLLAKDPVLRERIPMMLKEPEKRFGVDPATAISLSATLVIVLQTHIEIKRDKDGKWTLVIRKEALDNEVLKDFVKKLLSWVSKGFFD